MMTRLGSGSADETVQPSIRAHPGTHRRANDGAYRARRLEKNTRRESKEKNATRRDHAPVLARLGTFTTPSASSASASTSSSRGSSLTTASPPPPFSPPFSPPVSLPSSLDRAIDFLCSFVRASRSNAHVETNRNATRTRMEWKIQREIDRASFASFIHPSIHPSVVAFRRFVRAADRVSSRQSPSLKTRRRPRR